MAPRGRKKKSQKGLMRDDAARDAMAEYGFEMRLINETIKELLELYNEENANPWKLIEEGGYAMLLDRLLEKQAEQEKQLALENEELAVEEQVEPTQEEEEEKEQEHDVAEGRYHIGSSSTALLENGLDTEAQTCQTDALLVTDEVVKDSLPANFQSTIDSGGGTKTLLVTNETVKDSLPETIQSLESIIDSVRGTKALSVTNETVMKSSPAASQSAEATTDPVGGTKALSVTHEAVIKSSPAASQSAEATTDPVGGTQSSNGGWVSSEEESDPEKDGDDDDDNKMIQLTPEPLCEELEDLCTVVRRGERKRKRPTRWDE